MTTAVFDLCAQHCCPSPSNVESREFTSRFLSSFLAVYSYQPDFIDLLQATMDSIRKIFFALLYALSMITQSHSFVTNNGFVLPKIKQHGLKVRAWADKQFYDRDAPLFEASQPKENLRDSFEGAQNNLGEGTIGKRGEASTVLQVGGEA
jgi:hypothetical protein